MGFGFPSAPLLLHDSNLELIMGSPSLFDLGTTFETLVGRCVHVPRSSAWLQLSVNLGSPEPNTVPNPKP